MAFEKMKSYPLNESERILKKAYETGDKTLWEKPMSFSRYEQYEREGVVIASRGDAPARTVTVVRVLQSAKAKLLTTLN